MFNGLSDFSALNMQGDMSQRKTNHGKSLSRRNAEVDNNYHSHILYAVHVLFIIAMVSNAVGEMMVVVMLLSFILERLITNEGKNICHKI